MNRHNLKLLPLLLAGGAIAQTPADSVAAKALAVAQEATKAAQQANARTEAAEAASEAANGEIKVLKRLRELDAEDAAAKAKATPVVEAGASSLQFRSADKAWSIRFRGLVRTAATWDLNDETHKTTDRFQSHTVRFGAEGTLAKKLGYRVLADFSKGAVALQDGYSDINLAPWAQVRIGKFQVPLGWERYQSPSDLPFYDRAFPSSIAPNRDIGFQVSGEVLGGKLQYALAGVNGGADGSNINDDVNDDKDGYARLWAAPAKGSGNPWLEGLGIGVGGSYGYHDNVPTNYRTAGGQTFFTWTAGDSAKGAGYRIAPQASWTAGPYWVWGEWIRSVEEVRVSGTAAVTTDSVGKGTTNKGVVYRYTSKAATFPGPTTEVGVNAWQFGVSWVVTGEDASEKSVKPRHAFDGSENGGLGALEISARISGLTVDDEAFPTFADTLKSAESALSWAVAANWHLVKGTRLQVAYERTTFEGGAETLAIVNNKSVKQVRDRKPEGQLSVVASTSF